MNTGTRILVALALMGHAPAWLRRNTPLGPNTILGVLTGRTRTPGAATLDQLAKVLGVPPAWLTADVPQRQLTATEHEELLQCVQTLRALARGTRIDVRGEPNVRHEPRRTVPHQFKLRGARDVYRVRGPSLSGFGLLDGDLSYVKPLDRFAARDAIGSLVVLRLNGALFLKQLIVATRGKIVLRSAHPGYDPLTIHKNDKLELSGQVVASVREVQA